RLPRRLPDLFLRVQLRRSGRKPHNLQTRVSRKHRTDRRPLVPGSTIPEEQEWHTRILRKQLLKVQGRNLGIHQGRTKHRFPSSVEVKRAIKVGAVTSRISFDHRRLPERSPDTLQGCLQVECRFIATKDHGFGSRLRGIYEFFSRSSSNSI